MLSERLAGVLVLPGLVGEDGLVLPVQVREDGLVLPGHV